MLLYLVQHAEAKREEEDPLRPLSRKGLADINKVASYISKPDMNVVQIFHSGKLRAKQTAEVLLENLKPVKGLTETDGLNPLDDPQIWAERLKDVADNIMLVGHLPHLGRLSAQILCGDKGKNIVDFKMGGIVRMRRFEDGHWSIEWIITPEVVK